MSEAGFIVNFVVRKRLVLPASIERSNSLQKMGWLLKKVDLTAAGRFLRVFLK